MRSPPPRATAPHLRNPLVPASASQGFVDGPFLYRPEHEHDGCGVGFVADVTGTCETHKVLQTGLECAWRT